MKLKCYTTLLLLFLINGTGFAQDIVPTDTTKVSILRIDPSNAMGGNVSDVFSLVNYIPLETTSESIFGNISQLEILNGYYIILDYDKNAIFIFTLNGKYHSKIQGKPHSPIYKFLINKWTNQIIYTSDNYRTVTYCDLNGKVIKTEKNMSSNGIPNIYLNSHFISEDQLLSYDQYRNIDSTSKYFTSYTRSLLRFGNPIHAIGMPYSQQYAKIDILSTTVGPLTTFGNDTVFLFAKPYSYDLYFVSPHCIKQVYKLVFPQASSLPADFLTNSEYDFKRIDFIQKNPEMIFALNNCYLLGNNLLFEASSYKARQDDNILYNLESGNVIAIKHILPDSLSYNLPIIDLVSANFENIGFAYCDGSYIYTSLSSLCLFQTRDANGINQKTMPEILQSYFKKGTSKDNPVIVQLKLKANL
ncbi:hypothetical protein DCC81_11520 [Chitinophaga parva]|uniref:6-bladed beta-propeller n=1 Tax=Chitinophaga parva TaxID=2169414 RepID=A0A2T7BF82_9BACT|nr:6-bladed beta-propeller [Chitinophaga parva]PUZ24939.1 hypothetical protein DCC81_11520 [Chitinophaga parva]